MAVAVLFSLTTVCAGYAVVRLLGVARGPLGLGLTAPSGLAAMMVLSAWTVLPGGGPPLPAVGVFGLALLGLALAIADRQSLARAARELVSQQPLAMATLAAALAVPVIGMAIAFAGVVVPLSPHDGAAHVEAIQAYRLGSAWTDWYPPGMRTLFAAWLQGLPWLDTAEGGVDLGMSLPILAALAAFGLGMAVCREGAAVCGKGAGGESAARVGRSAQTAAAGALLLSFTYVYPYFPQIWSGWPLGLSLVLVMGLWAVGLEYLRQPSLGRAGVAGVMLGGVVLVHGSELYTLALVLPLVLLGSLRRVAWRALARDMVVAGVVALVCAAPYLPILLHWAGSGGTGYGISAEDGQVAQTAPGLSAPSDLFVVFGLGALGIDLPVRVALLAIGAVAAFRLRLGRTVVVVAAVFVAITSSFTLLGSIPLLQRVYDATFPWGMHYRMFMIVAICQALLAGMGAVVALGWLGRRLRGASAWARRGRRLMRLVGVAWLVLTTWSLVLFLAYPAGLVLGYSADDAAAMGWLRRNAEAGAVVINDGYADAGIWVPYKAGLPILLPRSASGDEMTSAGVVIDNIARLDQVPGARVVVCARHAMYVYRGARVSEWDTRRFPSLAAMRASVALEEVFASGEAAVFRIQTRCASAQGTLI
jgi:uncharacterized protein DUF6541